MRDPSTKDHRVEAAIEDARRHLARLTGDITSWTDRGADTLDPVQERRHAIAIVKTVADNLADPDLSGLLRKTIPALERTRPAIKRHGRKADLWRERNQLIVKTIEVICQEYRFRPTRNPASRDKNRRECGCSIVSTALDRLGIKLSEKTINQLWNNS
jgi:hypothetical protein